MTNHWRDIKNADVILIAGANPAEAHPVGFQWFVKAKLDPARGIGNGGGAAIIHVDPRFTRATAVADIHARIRVGTDVALFGGLIRHVIENDLIHRDYVRDYTNASFLVDEGFGFNDGLFSGYDKDKRRYDATSWAHETDEAATRYYVELQSQAMDAAMGGQPAGHAPKIGAAVRFAKRGPQLAHPHCVFQLLRTHYARYTP